jgi:hypothetical protein
MKSAGSKNATAETEANEITEAEVGADERNGEKGKARDDQDRSRQVPPIKEHVIFRIY